MPFKLLSKELVQLEDGNNEKQCRRGETDSVNKQIIQVVCFVIQKRLDDQELGSSTCISN